MSSVGRRANAASAAPGQEDRPSNTRLLCYSLQEPDIRTCPAAPANPYCTALTALFTQAMIADLKADSARWDQERRNHSGGTLTSHDSSAFLMRSSKSNSPPARYSDSQNRFSGAGLSQYDTSGAIYPPGPSRDSYESVPRYPGSDAPGYSASTGSQPYQQDSRQSGYGVQYPQTATYPPQQDSRFQVPAQTSAFPDYPNSHPTSLGAPDSRTYVRGGNMTTQPPQQRMVPQPYPDGRMETESHFSSYPNQTPGYYTAGLSSYPPQQPEDVLSGRHAYGSTGQFDRQLDRQYEPQPQYENQTPPPSRPVASSSSQAQTGHSGTSHSRRGDRERDRDDRPRRR